ncbi:NAD(P)-dependent oxidoreductase [Brevibacillus choshinensis]|uniref:NAD(P)-dependent oxidoreductase n=1 Tax=Brevibacillus choshinensis TaxID=54911 RepID=UPI002E23F580|nr:NAD(P)-dependent oxidoreductase [Brevibacillus choshinensis]MED4584996.1 NAD(P)-dependent oxidoreductase [Brevibacillus choshinensis]MED4753661.1 NAD(P)-dependent oxidoreductase [Brevibacillus choshinensis]
MNVLITGYFNDYSKQLVTQSFPEDWNVQIVEPEQIESFISEANVLIPEHIEVNEVLLNKAKNLKFVQTGAGFDNVDIEACTKKNIWVSNAAGVNANAVAEHIMALILGYYKNISFLDQSMKNREDETKLEYVGGELLGKTIGTIGFGAIGSRVAELAKAFKMKVLAYDTNKNIQSNDVEMVDLDTLVKNADVITINIFLNESTRNLVNKEFLSKMKRNALLVNTARGPIVCEDDLIEALKNNVIGGACLDVFTVEPLQLDSELRTLKNVVLTPHTAGMPDGTKFHEVRYRFFVQNILRIQRNETPQNNLNQIK